MPARPPRPPASALADLRRAAGQPTGGSREKTLRASQLGDVLATLGVEVETKQEALAILKSVGKG